MRASMAVPSIFAPIKIDSLLLVDGGVLRNIAISELKNMGADIIIGSYTGFHRYKEEEFLSAVGILKQIAFLQSVIDYNEEKKNINLIIEPNVKDYPSTVFSNSDSIIQRGYKAALPFKPYFKKLADSLNRLGPQKKPEFILDRQYYAFDKIEVTGNINNPDEQILGVLDIKPGEQVDKYLLSEKIELLYGKTWFDKVKYRIEPHNDSLILIIECQEKDKAIVYGSVHYDNALKAGIILNMSLKNILSAKSSFDFDSFIGQFYRFRVNYTQYIDRNQEVGLSLIFNTDKTVIPIMELRALKGEYLSRTLNTELNLNKMTGLNRMVSLSASLENLSLIPDFISEDNLERVTFNSYSIGYQYQTNNIDTKYFPNKGTVSQIGISTTKLLSGSIKTAFSEKRYTREIPEDFQFSRAYRINAGIKHYFSPAGKLTFSFSSNLLYTYSADTALSQNNFSYLGGFDNVTKRSIAMTGFHSNEIPVEKVASAGFAADIEFSKDLHLEFMADFAAAVEAGMGDEIAYLGGYGLGLGYRSLIGPLRIGIMHGLSSSERYFDGVKGYISIGFCF
jgi:NTE family protein